MPSHCIKNGGWGVGALVQGGGVSPFAVEVFLLVVGGKGGAMMMVLWWKLALWAKLIEIGA